MKPLHLLVVTPAETLLDAAEVDSVHVQLADGCGIGIYPGHAPLLAETVTAPLRYTSGPAEHTLDLQAGILEIDAGNVTILTSGEAQTAKFPETAEAAQEVRFDRLAQTLLAMVEAQPDEGSDTD